MVFTPNARGLGSEQTIFWEREVREIKKRKIYCFVAEMGKRGREL
jgi:hypothetical protein